MLVYISVADENIVIKKTVELIEDLINVDYNSDGKIIGVEILDGKQITIEEERGTK